MTNIGAFAPPPQPWTGTRAAWIDAYTSARGRMQPNVKPAEIVADAHASQRTQGDMAPGMIAYLDAELGLLRA